MPLVCAPSILFVRVAKIAVINARYLRLLRLHITTPHIGEEDRNGEMMRQILPFNKNYTPFLMPAAMPPHIYRQIAAEETWW